MKNIQFVSPVNIGLLWSHLIKKIILTHFFRYRKHTNSPFPAIGLLPFQGEYSKAGVRLEAELRETKLLLDQEIIRKKVIFT